jgi:hypothetical protein
MKILFWGPVTMQQLSFLDRAHSPWRGLEKAHRHIRGVKKNFFKPPHDGYQKTQNFV